MLVSWQHPTGCLQDLGALYVMSVIQATFRGKSNGLFGVSTFSGESQVTDKVLKCMRTVDPNQAERYRQRTGQ